MAAPERQTLLPNYDGRCRRYAALRQQLIEAAHAGGVPSVPTALETMRREVEEMLLPVMGPEPMKLGGRFSMMFLYFQIILGDVGVG